MVKLGHRPSRNEWIGLKPKMSYNTIQRHFGGWGNACLKFIEYKPGGMIIPEDNTPIDKKDQIPAGISNTEKQRDWTESNYRKSKNNTIES